MFSNYIFSLYVTDNNTTYLRLATCLQYSPTPRVQFLQDYLTFNAGTPRAIHFSQSPILNPDADITSLLNRYKTYHYSVDHTPDR